MRGKDDEGRLKLRHVGITPAYAGKSQIPQMKASRTRDHPRVCGEKGMTGKSPGCGTGSPPRMRGKAVRSGTLRRKTRITPAYAGKRRPALPLWRCGKDHPRVCGEKKAMQMNATSKTGSPPRMRGKAGRLRGLQAGRGITPAYAGKRLYEPLGCITKRDHPRVCGEKMDGSAMPTARLGSPPRMRGKEQSHKAGACSG